MIFVSQLLSALILPPGCIIIGLIFASVFVPRRRKIGMILITALLYFLSIQPGSDFLLLPLEDAYPPLLSQDDENHNTVEAIVVLGGGTIQHSPEAGSEKNTLSADAVKRAVYAYSLRNDFPAVYVFTGGKVFNYIQETEAETAERLFTGLGLPLRRIVLETKSRNTWENAKETAKLGYKQIVLVTSAYHMRRSVSSFERNGMNVIPAPTDYKCDRGRKYNFFSFLPMLRYLNTSYLALHEYIGLFSYRIFYRPCS